MLDFKTQSEFVDAAASIVRAYFRAAANTLAASAGQSWSIWSELMQASNSATGRGRLPQSSLRLFGIPAIDWLGPPNLTAPRPVVPWLSSKAPGANWPPLAGAWWFG